MELNIYTKPTCPYCNNLKRILNERRIQFTDYDITKNEPLRRVVDRDGHIPVPQIDIGGKIIYDYKTEESLVETIEALLR